MTLGATILQPRGAPPASTTGVRTGSLAPELLSQSANGFAFWPCSTPSSSSWRASSPPSCSLQTARVCSRNRSTGCLVSSPSRWRSWLWAFTLSARVPLSTVMNVGLCFEVVSSYGIAFAEYLEPTASQ